MGFDADGWWLVASAFTGIAPDMLKLLSLLVLSTPLSIPVIYLTKTPVLLHVYSILVSVWFLIGVFDLRFGLLQLSVASLSTWLACYYWIALPSRSRFTSQSKKSSHLASNQSVPPTTAPWLICAGLLAHLTINHSRRIFWNVPYEKVEVTGAQMVLVMKLSTFAWNVYDGHRPVDQLDAYQRSTAIQKMPNILEFLAYCFFFPSLLVGPAIPFAQYKAFVDGKLVTSQGKIPCALGRFAHAFKSILIGFGFAGVVAFYGSRWSYAAMLEDAFLEKSWIQRLLHVQAAGFMARGKYYIVWSLSEAALTMSGCGFDALTGTWTAGQNIDIARIELAQNYKGVFDHWNMKTNIWLRECVYKRVPLPEPKPGQSKPKPGFSSTMATFAASAAWHGPLPAYFIVFLSGGMLQALGRSIRGSIRPFFLRTGLKQIYDVICLVVLQTNLNYLVIPFILLEVQPSLEAYRRVGWYGHLSSALLTFPLWFGGERYLRKRLVPKAASGTTSSSISSPTKAEILPGRMTAATVLVTNTEGGFVKMTTPEVGMEKMLAQLKPKTA